MKNYKQILKDLYLFNEINGNDTLEDVLKNIKDQLKEYDLVEDDIKELEDLSREHKRLIEIIKKDYPDKAIFHLDFNFRICPEVKLPFPENELEKELFEKAQTLHKYNSIAEDIASSKRITVYIRELRDIIEKMKGEKPSEENRALSDEAVLAILQEINK